MLERPEPPAEVFPSHDPSQRPLNFDFLNLVVAWLSKNWDTFSRSRRLAIDVIRTARETFFGIGVYSACEIFLLAGACTSFLYPTLLS